MMKTRLLILTMLVCLLVFCSATLAEAEYALIVRWHKVESGIKYIISTTSYHRDYEAYAVDLKTGESVRFWAQRNGANVVVPENAGGVPVTCVLPHAIDDLSHVESVTLPQSVRTVRFGAICAHGGSNNRKVSPFHLYVASPETAFEEGSVRRYGGNETTVTIHAPEGSAA